MDALVSTEWLERELGASDLRVVDATKFMAGTDRDARAEYEAGHIPGAVFMDLTELADATSAVPRAGRSAWNAVAGRSGALSVGRGASCPRAWAMRRSEPSARRWNTRNWR